MSDTALNNLRQAIVAAAASPFALDSSFLTKGMSDGSVSVPAGYDSDIGASYQIASAAAFKIQVAASNVGPVANSSFIVKSATIPFLGSILKSEATLVFGLTKNGSELVVQIQTSIQKWTWSDSFPFMQGWPFDQLAVSGVQFVFSTAQGQYPWTNSLGLTVAGGAKQNFFASLALPDVVKPLLALFDGLQPPSGNLSLSGALDMSQYNQEMVIYPSGTLTAALSNASFKVFYLTVSSPSITLQIPAPTDQTTLEGSDQSPLLAVSAGIKIGGAPSDPSPYVLQVYVSPPIGGAGGQAGEFSIGLVATGEGTPLTPATIASLVGGGASYFTGAPPVLQQFLAFVSLQGLSLSGSLPPQLKIGQVSVEIGSTKNTRWSPLPPAGKLDFTITGFSLQWTIINPFDGAARQQNFLFSTQFILAPSVFKGPKGEGDGIFTVQFTSGLQFYAGFDGTAKLSDFLTALTDGAVSLPSSIEAELENIRFNLDYSAQSFSFSSGFGLSIGFLTVGDKPIISISDGQITLAAMSPTQSGGKSQTALSAANDKGTAWRSEISGLMAVGPIGANVTVGYDGTLTPTRWNLKAELAQPITVQELIGQFFDPSGTYGFPDFLPGTLTIKTFDINAVIPSGQGNLATSYSIQTTFSWLFDMGDQKIGIDPAKIALQYDGSKGPGLQFSGSAEGTWVYTAINLKLLIGYQFEGTGPTANKILFLDWQGFRAQYESGKEEIAFTIKGWTLGALIQALVRTLGDPYFTLSSPWDLLNKISLEGLGVVVSLKSGETNRLSARYTLPSPLDLGFITIKSLTFRRDTNGKVTLAIDGSIPSALASDPKMKDLVDPAKGQDVQNMPSVPGRGTSYFKVFLLVLGQRIGITGSDQFNNTKEVITALEKVPSTTGKLNPVNPNANKSGTKEPPPKGLPYYNQSNNWLIAGHLGLLEATPGVWTVDAMVVFNDPNLYGLRLALAGAKVGGLQNLAIDILYKKITDDVGVFQIEFTFPDAIRNLNFGSVSITLPQIGIKIYTNGDFFIDIGFPYNLDFRRSFSIAAIVYGVPVLGSGGFYFGKLSSATATQVPKTKQGTFDPIIVFGLGLQLGLGYNFTKGPLSAGFAITIFGIIEGVIAAWHPYSPAASPQSVTKLGAALQSDYYFKISGTVGIIGLLYGKIDFKIIQASVNVKITLSLQITYESYREIPIVASATVDVSVRVKIDLGLFSISISLSFSTSVSAKFIVGANETAPWDDKGTILAAARKAALLSEDPEGIRLEARSIVPRPKRILLSDEPEKPVLTAVITPQFTVLAPEGSTDYAAQQGAFVFLFAMDAPDATNSASSNGDTSFEKLCAAYFPWLIDTLGNPEGDTVNLAQTADITVSKEDLQIYLERIADVKQPALTMTDLLQFLQSGFTLDIETPDQAQVSGLAEKLQSGATLFPVFDGLSLSIPDPSGTGAKPVTFESYATATPGYRSTVADIFAEIQAFIEFQNRQTAAPRLKGAETADSMAALIFTDTFAIIGRQLLQAAIDSMQSYAYPLKPDKSIQSILDRANPLGNNLTPNDVAIPNQNHNLSGSIRIEIPALNYMIQANDTLAGIAKAYSDSDGAGPRWTTTADQLVISNGSARIIQAGIKLILQGKTELVEYTTAPGDFFEHIAKTLDISLTNLASQTVLYGAPGLLSPVQAMTIPPIAYMTAAGSSTSEPSPDTLSNLAEFFTTTVSELAASNLKVEGLFSTGAQGGLITLANLSVLTVGDLWSAIESTEQVAQTAGMVSRFLMFGLRLPDETGLVLSSEFLYPAQQDAYGLYQLTGQQFPTPNSLGSGEPYSVTVSRADSSHGVDLSFVEFNGAVSKSADVVLTDAYGLLSVVLGWARTPFAFAPSPGFESLPLSTRSPKQFAMGNFALWSTSALGALERLTDRGIPASGPSGTQNQPILWPLPPSILQLSSSRQATLSGTFQTLRDVIPLMPQFQPQVGTTSPASSKTSFAKIDRWAWSTRVDFTIKRLPSVEAMAVAETGAGSSPNGPASAPSLPNVYELVGPSSEDGLVLERLLQAMDALGEGIISGVFILYQQSGASAPTLVTLGEDEFLSFITQTNLSTETNPERAFLRVGLAGAAPRGIANPRGEFIKLLWELSVVRSGGYYLYYRVADGGAGFPASVFDAGGTGTLSLVVTYAAQGGFSFGSATLDFVNSFLTTDPIDTARNAVQLESQGSKSRSAPLSGIASETLASVSALYGSAPGRIADLNSSTALASGKVIQVSGIVRQLIEGDITDPSKTLDNLAAYYSAGAQTPITAAQIQNSNPGVEVGLGAVYYIPPINYIVAPASTPGASPGNSFASMAGYYGLSIDAVAVSALLVGGLFNVNTVLQIDTQLLDVTSTLGPGNISFLLDRTNLGQPPVLPQDPTPAQKADYAMKYMYSLYNTLSAGLQANPYFEVSSFGLPFGPEDLDGEAGAAFASHAQIQESRRTRLQSVAEEDFKYSQPVGFGKFSLVNPAPANSSDPDSPESGLPPRESNPYIGVGSTAQVALRWQDLFGNTTVTPFENPPANYAGGLNGSSVTIRYNDRLIGVSSWPNVKASYIYGQSSDAALQINFGLDTARYAEDKDQAQRDLALFQRVYFQLHQDYSGARVPGVSGNAVSMSLSNSLMAAPDTELTEAQAKVIRDFISECVEYLSWVVNKTKQVDPPKAQLSVPVSTDGIAPGNVIRLDVALTFRRQAILTEAIVAATADGLSVTSVILPQADPEQTTIAYTGFAKAFESVFQTSKWYLKIGEGLKQSTGSQNNTSQQLWAARFGKTKGEGIFFEIGQSPGYYAPTPIARSLESKKVTIVNYETSASSELTFTGVDQNLWFQTCLDAVDGFLSPVYSPSAFILDKLLNTADPLKDGYLGKVLKAKKSLADSISARVKPILSTSPADDSTLRSAKEKLRQQLLNQLGAAYAAGAVTVFGLSDVSGAPASANDPPNLYGQPVGSVETAANQNYTLSSARIPLGQVKVSDGSGGSTTYAPRLAFVFTSKNVPAQAFVPIPMELKISHLEFDRTPVPGIEGYVQSQWLAFVNGPFTYQLGSGTSNIPVVNRALPTPPTVQNQSAQKHLDNPIVPADLAKWDYSFEYLYQAAAQDSAQVTVELNVAADQQLRALAAGPDLFQALAQFVSSYPAISRDFAQYLVKIGQGAIDQTTVENATKAVSTFEQLVTDVASAYAGGAAARALAAAAFPELVKIEFEAALTDDQGNARTDILGLLINGTPATWDSANNTISNGTITVPAVIVEIKPDLYDAEPVNPPPDKVTLAYLYKKKPTGTGSPYLPYSEALADAKRTIALKGLDLLAFQNGWSSIFVERNRILFPVSEIDDVKTTDFFLFQTPTVRFANAIVPRLVYASFELGTLKGSAPGKLRALLDEFFAGLFAAGSGNTTADVSLSAAYSYLIAKGLPRVMLPISLLPPTETPVISSPPPAFTAPVADSIDIYRREQNPTTEGKPQVNFYLSVFGMAGAKQPLIVVDDLFSPVKE